MNWYNNIFRSVEDVWIVWTISCLLLYLFTRALCSKVRRWNGSRFVREERGASYSLGVVLVVPFYVLLIATVVESTLMLVVKTGTTYAAFAAARAAIVWLPDDRIPSSDAPDYIPPASRQGMVHLAAVNAMWPYASGSEQHAAGGAGAFAYDPEAAQACIEAYRRYSGGKAPEAYLDRKWRYAAKATQIKIEHSSEEFNADLSVTVEFEMPLNIPGVGRFLGGRASWGGAKYFTRKISSNATLEKEGPKSDNQSLGIAYYRDFGFQGRQGAGGAGVVSDVNPVENPTQDLPELATREARRQSIITGTPGRIRVANTDSDAGREPAWYERDSIGRETVTTHLQSINRIAAELGVDPKLVKAIMYAENARGWYDSYKPGQVKSIRPMNVHVDFWRDLGWSRAELMNDETNIRAGVTIIKGIVERLEDPTVEKVATLYNSLSKDKVTEYGTRVGVIYRGQLWE